MKKKVKFSFLCGSEKSWQHWHVALASMCCCHFEDPHQRQPKSVHDHEALKIDPKPLN